MNLEKSTPEFFNPTVVATCSHQSPICWICDKSLNYDPIKPHSAAKLDFIAIMHL